MGVWQAASGRGLAADVEGIAPFFPFLNTFLRGYKVQVEYCSNCLAFPFFTLFSWLALA